LVDGRNELGFGLTSIPIAYTPAIKDPSELKWVREEKPDAPDLVTCWKQAEPVHKLANLKMPIVVVTSEASYHAPYDHCTVRFLDQAGGKPPWLTPGARGIKGNSHNMMQEKNSNDIAAVIYQWLEKAVAAAT